MSAFGYYTRRILNLTVFLFLLHFSCSHFECPFPSKSLFDCLHCFASNLFVFLSCIYFIDVACYCLVIVLICRFLILIINLYANYSWCAITNSLFFFLFFFFSCTFAYYLSIYFSIILTILCCCC